MKNYILHLTSYIFLSFILSSCNKEVEKPKIFPNESNLIAISESCDVNSINIVNNRIKFQDAESFFCLTYKISSLNEEEYEEWTKLTGFYSKSFNIICDSARAVLEQAETESEFFQILNQYSNFLRYDDDNTIRSKFNLRYYQSFINYNGEYAVGNTLCKIVKGKLIQVLDGDEMKLASANINTQTDYNLNIVVDTLIEDGSNNLTPRSPTPCCEGQYCAESNSAIFTRSDGKRRVTTGVDLVITYSDDGNGNGSVITPWFRLYVFGEKEKGLIWYYWDEYKTRLQVQNSNLIWDNCKNSSLTVFNYNFDSGTKERKFEWRQVFVPSRMIYSYTRDTKKQVLDEVKGCIRKIYQEGKSRGTDVDGWAIVKCNW